jgi:2-iminobutanoate/2-iminopropanoate deaminase
MKCLEARKTGRWIATVRRSPMNHRTVNLIPADLNLPISSAVIAGDFVFVSGHVGDDPNTGKAPNGFEAQAVLTLENIRRALEAAGTSMENVVKTTVYLTSVGDFASLNDVYRRYFPSEPPARTTIGVRALARPNLLIEIEAIALLPGAEPA